MKKDILNRAETVNRLKSFILELSNNKRDYCFAINGKWGSGKSFVLGLLEKELREYQSEETYENQFFLVHYNCWQYDYYDEPSIAIVSALLNSVEEEKSFLGREIDGKVNAAYTFISDEVKSIAGKFLENHIGIDPIGIYEKIMKESDEAETKKQKFDTMFSFKTTLDEVRVSLRKIAKEKTVVVVVDELDRCIPEYAVKVLERLHHLFEGIGNIIVIVAVDKTQLSHSIRTIYGENTEVEEYLKKIINLTFELDNGKISEGVLEKYQSYFQNFEGITNDNQSQVEKFFSDLWNGVDIRTQEKMMSKIESMHRLLTMRRLDISAAMLELVCSKFSDGNLESIKWLSCVFKKNRWLQDKISLEKIEFMKELEENAKTGYEKHIPTWESTRILYQLNNEPIGKMFYLLEKVLSTENNYYMVNELDLMEEIEVAKKFVQLLDIIT